LERKILYKKSVSKDLDNIHPEQRLKIVNRIEKDLTTDCNKGKRLAGEFEGLWRLRIGDYRVIYTFIPEGILILRIAHRKEIYR